MVESIYPSSFWNAVWGYPAMFAVLCGAIGTRQNVKERDRRHWRDTAQLSLKLVSSIHAIIVSRAAARDVFDNKWTSYVDLSFLAYKFIIFSRLEFDLQIKSHYDSLTPGQFSRGYRGRLPFARYFTICSMFI